MDFDVETALELYRQSVESGYRAAGDPACRFVVFDQETTGLDPRNDRLVSIGAVGVCGGEILLDDTFEEMVRFDLITSSVLIHGVTREQAMLGSPEKEAVARFLGYVGNAVLVGHHVLFDFEVLRRAAWRQFAIRVENPCLDTMTLALALNDAGLLSRRPETFDFDSLCEFFGIAAHDRHTAAGDAFLTAQIYLRLWKMAIRGGLPLEPYEEQADPWTPELPNQAP